MPATVQAVLAARIDRLPQDEKHLLQTASVIGTEVPFSLLQAIVELSGDALYRSLAHLQQSEFLYETNLFPERIYTFKHALTHEVAYSSMLQERRRVLHAEIVETLEQLTGDQVADQVERLAHHAFRGEVWDKALRYFRQAGSKALDQSAYEETVVCFEQALKALDHLPKERETQEQAIDVRLALRNALHPLLKWEEALIYLREAEQLAEVLGDQSRLGRIYNVLAFTMRTNFDYSASLAYSRRAQAIGTALEDVNLQAGGTHYQGQVYAEIGNYHRAIACYRQNIALLQGELLYASFGNLALPSFQNRIFLVESLNAIGAFAEGHAVGDEATRIAEKLDHPYERVSAYLRMGDLHLRQGYVQQAAALLERSLSLANETEVRNFRIVTAASLATAYARAGRRDEALTLMRSITEQVQRLGWTVLLLPCTEVYFLVGDLEEANALARHAIERAQALKERGHEASAWWLLGKITMHRESPDIDRAKTHYQHALTTADELGMRPLQAHCHRGLGTLYSQTGKFEQARVELTTAIEMYRDMEMTFWLPETEAELDDMEG